MTTTLVTEDERRRIGNYINNMQRDLLSPVVLAAVDDTIREIKATKSVTSIQVEFLKRCYMRSDGKFNKCESTGISTESAETLRKAAAAQKRKRIKQ